MEETLIKKCKKKQSTKINLIGCDTIVNSPSQDKNVVAQGLIPGMSRSESAITRGKTQMMLLPPTSFS
jgi:hypothetical protein